MPGSADLRLQAGQSTVLDLGENTTGHVQADLAFGAIQVSLSEARRYLQPGGDIPAGRGFSFGRDDNPDGRVINFQRGRSASTLHGGYRYLLVQAKRATMIHSLHVRTAYLEPNPRAAWFESSNPRLNAIWDASVHTLALSTARGPNGWVMTDGAKRDRLIWAGDLQAESLSAPYVSREFLGAVKRSLGLLACYQAPDGYIPMSAFPNAACGQPVNDPIGLMGPDVLPSYTPAWISALANYYLASGNAAEVVP